MSLILLFLWICSQPIQVHEENIVVAFEVNRVSLEHQQVLDSIVKVDGLYYTVFKVNSNQVASSFVVEKVFVFEILRAWSMRKVGEAVTESEFNLVLLNNSGLI